MAYYKAVRPNGTSFHNGIFRWLPESGPVEGHTVTHPTASYVGRYASQYLSVSVSPTDCTGMEWPCRLFEVEPVDGHEVTVPHPATMPNKRAAVAWRIVRELPATDALGPQGAQVAALIKRVGRLTDADDMRLYDAWCAAMYTEGKAAWDAARAGALDVARSAAWVAVRDAAIGATLDDAALALLARDIISTVHYDALTMPWRTAIGPIHPDDPDFYN